MKLELDDIPTLFDKKVETGFAWLPKIITCGKKRTLIWMESYVIVYSYNPANETPWTVTEWKGF